MGYWRSQILSRIRKIFDKSSSKKMAAEEACSDFDDFRELINLEFEEKKEELRHKVKEIYSISSVDTKAVLKERTAAVIKKKPTGALKLLEKLVKIDFPGSKQAYDYSLKFGPAMVSGPVCFVLEKVFVIIIEEERKAAEKAEAEAAIKKEKKNAEAAIKEEKKNAKEDAAEIVEESREIVEESKEEIIEESREEIIEESREEIVEEPTKVEVEKQQVGEETEPERPEIVMETVEPPMIVGEAEAPAAAPKV